LTGPRTLSGATQSLVTWADGTQSAVSIGSGTVIEDSEVSQSILGRETRISKSRLTNSLIGESIVLEGLKGEVTVGDHSEIRLGD
jgi:ADP-glucose pyrophosphorylase